MGHRVGASLAVVDGDVPVCGHLPLSRPIGPPGGLDPIDVLDARTIGCVGDVPTPIGQGAHFRRAVGAIENRGPVGSRGKPGAILLKERDRAVRPGDPQEDVVGVSSLRGTVCLEQIRGPVQVLRGFQMPASIEALEVPIGEALAIDVAAAVGSPTETPLPPTTRESPTWS